LNNGPFYSPSHKAMGVAVQIERKLCAFACQNAKDHEPCNKCSAGYFQGNERESIAAIIDAAFHPRERPNDDSKPLDGHWNDNATTA